MKKRVKLVCLLLMAALSASMLFGCGGASENVGTGAGASQPASVTTDETSGADAAEVDVPEDTTVSAAVDEVMWEIGEASSVVWTDSIGTTWIQIAVPVTNTGSANLYLNSGTMDLEDETGHLLDSESLVSAYPQVIQPGETAWYYEETTLDAEARQITVVPHVDVDKAKVECIRFEVSDLSLKDETYGGISVTGRVENATADTESMVYVVALLYDANDGLLGQAFTILTDELAAGETIGFSASSFSVPDSVTADSIARYDVYAFPYQFQF